MFKRIRNLREDHDLKQSDIANQLGLSRPQYQLYESGKRQVPVDIVIRLSQIYNVSIDYLLGLTNSKTAPSPPLSVESKKILSYFGRLNTENKDYILGEMVKLYRQQEEVSDRKKDTG